MKIAVFGASGRTGILIVYQALNQGFTVTAFARKAENVTIRHKNLTVIQGELTDLPKISEAVEGQDAVLCALGMDSNKPSRVLSEGTRRILEAMEECGVKRFICMSSAGILGNDAGFWFGKVIKPLFLRHVFADKLRQVEVIRESRAKWVILRPVGLTDSPKTNSYKVNPGIPTSRTVPRADVADFMLKLVTDTRYDFTLPALSSY
ncbi:MAG TPA: SDR family oxidoreductase [Bacteroidales bacterium]|nr:SDR family oxidoreductase [Bacteroidales bacterium]HPT10088.1 SDR family oxidoreductase [Bacteroidales bacterium]